MNSNEKMREALDEIIEKIDNWRTDGLMEHWIYSQLFDIADSARAKPPKNCDVGTAEEQRSRFYGFCFSFRTCKACPLFLVGKYRSQVGCAIAWSQMPYEKGGEK